MYINIYIFITVYPTSLGWNFNSSFCFLLYTIDFVVIRAITRRVICEENINMETSRL